jgi:hypothetical protein
VAKLPVSYPTLTLPVGPSFVQAVISMFQRIAGSVNELYDGGGTDTTTFVFLDGLSTYALPASPVLNQNLVLNSNDATTLPKTVTGPINGGTSFLINMSYESYGFVWNGTEWRIW